MWFLTSLPGGTSVAKHGVATRRRGRLHFLLHYVPVFDQLAIRHTKDIDRDHWLRSPPDVAAVHHHQISLRARGAWGGLCQHKVEMSAFAPSRDVRGCVDQGSTEDAEDDAAARSRFLARSVTFGLARRAASRSCCCAAIQAKTLSRCWCSTTTPGTSRA